MQHFRYINNSELSILIELIKLSNLNLEMPNNYVRISGNEGLYSLVFSNKTITEDKRIFKKKISEMIFKDHDGIQVIASLYIDNNDELFEIDFWKVDYSTIECLNQ